MPVDTDSLWLSILAREESLVGLSDDEVREVMKGGGFAEPLIAAFLARRAQTDGVFCDGCGRTVTKDEVASRDEPWDSNCETCTFCKDAPLEREAFTRGYNHGLDKLAEATVHTAQHSGMRRRIRLVEPMTQRIDPEVVAKALGAEMFTPTKK